MPNTQNKQSGQASNSMQNAQPGIIVNSYASNTTSNTTSQAGTSQTMAISQQNMQQGGQQQQQQTVVGVFNSRHQAEQAVQALRNQGFTNEEISVITKQGSHDKQEDKSGQAGGVEHVNDDITDGALTGGTLGGLGGLIVGAGALAIPGVGPIIAAGPIAAALSGAVAGGIAGGLIDWGIPAEVSRRYEQDVAHGNVLAIVQTTQQKVNQAAQILRQNGANEVDAHDAHGSKNRH